MADCTIDIIVAGAGLCGASCARVLAERGYRVAVLERRACVAGNAHDAYDAHGVLVHTYGPHIFHTSSSQVFSFVRRFCSWHTYEHRVLAKTAHTTLELPFNLNNLTRLYDTDWAQELEGLLGTYFAGHTSVEVQRLMDANDTQIAQLGQRIYEEIFKHYSHKQWGGAHNFDPSVLRRVPVRLSRDNRYFTDQFQGLPADGYTNLVQQMLNHPLITLHLNCDARRLLTCTDMKMSVTPDAHAVLGAPCAQHCQVVWTGAVDELFDYRFGDLPYRSLDLSFVTHQQRQVQEVATINYTSLDVPYTRSTEFKLMTGQTNVEQVTTVCFETPLTFDRHAGHHRFYPLVTEAARTQYEAYRRHANQLTNLTLAGRLATYTYLDMDKVIASGMKTGACIADKLSTLS